MTYIVVKYHVLPVNPQHCGRPTTRRHLGRVRPPGGAQDGGRRGAGLPEALHGQKQAEEAVSLRRGLQVQASKPHAQALTLAETEYRMRPRDEFWGAVCGGLVILI